MHLLLILATTTWVTASKKKNLLTTNVLTSMTAQAAMTARREMMFMTLMTFRITYPGPAKGCLRSAILEKESGNVISTLVIKSSVREGVGLLCERDSSSYILVRVVGDVKTQRL